MPELPLHGYYRGGPTYVDSYLFLRLYPDGFCVYHDSMDEDFDFPAYLAALDVEAIKRNYPRGHSHRDERGVWRDSVGRFVRQADATVLSFDGHVVGRLPDGLVLTSWNEDLGEFRLGEMKVVGPGRLQSTAYDGNLVFVPDQPVEPGAAADADAP